MSTKEEIIEKFNLFPLVPLTSYSKKPFCQWSQKENWITDINGCNIKKFSWINKEGQKKQGQITGFALLLGKKSNVTVIDLDVGHSDDTNGIESFKKLIEDLPPEDIQVIKSTLTIQTPRGGYHLYFKYIEGIKGTANYFKNINLPGIDVRTEGNIVPIPSSKIQIDRGTTKIYSIKNDFSIQTMPKSLIDLFINHKCQQRKRGRPKESNKYYATSNEGSRDNTLISWLGHIVKCNPNLRNKDELLPLAEMYNLRYLNPPLAGDIVNDKVDSILNMAEPSYIDKNKIVPYRLAEAISMNETIISDDFTTYVYRENYYQELINDCYDEIDTLVSNKSLIKMSLVNEVSSQLKKQTNIAKLTNGAIKVVENQRGYINFKNGLYDVEKENFIPHSKDILSLYQVNSIYDPDKSDISGTNFERFLNTSICSEDISIIQEMIGLCLYPLTNKIAYFYILTGNGRNGKGVLLDVIQAIIPKQSTSHISLEDVDTKFTNSALKGKCLNVCSDDPTKYIDKTGALKRFTSGEPVDVEHKGKDPITIQPYITIISAMNSLPSISDKSQGLYDRLIMVPFNKSFGTKEEVEKGLKDMIRDPLLKEKIIKHELPNVVAWGMKGLKRIINNNYKLTISSHSIKAKNELRSENDSVYAFYNDCIYKSKGTEINATVLYEAYTSYCKFKGLISSSQSSFGKEIRSKYNIEKTKRGIGVFYLNIKIKSPYKEI